jgi:gamma-glutamyltranspeptidase / glutathione hydrolase
VKHTPAVPQHSVYGYGGMVSAGGSLAAASGLDAMRSGGNAVDAVIAAAYVQSVVEFPWGGIGGDAFVLVRTPTGEVFAMNGSGAAPMKLGAHVAEGETIGRFGPLSVSVPCFSRAVEALHTRFGSKSFADLIGPAIEYADDGFAMTPELRSACTKVLGTLEQGSGLRELLESNSLEVGSRFMHKHLAATLSAVAEGGADVFAAEIGEKIASSMAARGGALTPDDFAASEPCWTDPMSLRYRGVDVRTHPPVSMGGVLLIELGLYERLAIDRGDPLDPIRVDAMVRCKHAAFARWTAVMNDPELRGSEEPELAGAVHAALLDESVLNSIAEDLLSTPVAELRRPEPPGDGSDTTCVVAADSEGYCAAIIHSLFNEFGSRELDPATGVLLNDRLANQRYATGGLGGIAGGHRPQHTLNAVFIDGGDQPSMMLATPGGRGQVQSNLQVIANVYDAGLDVQQAIDAPRWLSGAPRRPEPNDHLFLEPGFPTELRDALTARGHKIAEPDEVSSDLFGSCIAVGRSSGGALYAAADHRREARTASY